MSDTTPSRVSPAPPASYSPVSGQGGVVVSTGKVEKAENRGFAHRDPLLNLLSQSDQRIGDLIKICRAQLAQMREDETSYFHFINAENTLGMSSWWLGRPASSFRYDAARHYVSALEDLRFSIDTVRAHIEYGELPLTKPAVQKFLDSPIGRAAHWRKILEYNTPGIPEHLATLDDDALAAALVSLANRCDSDDMAILTAKSFRSIISQTAYHNILPDSSIVFWNDYGREIINSTVSLPQLAGYATGAGIGMAIARSTKAASVALGALTTMGRGRYLLPGATLVQTTTAAGWRAHWLTRTIANFGFSFVQLNAYAGIGYLIAGRAGAEAAGAILMGGIGAATGFAQGLLQKLAAELAARDANGILAQWFLRDRMPQYARVSLSVELPAVDSANTFKLVTAKNARPTYTAMTEFQDDLMQAERAQIEAINRAEQEAARVQQQQAALARRQAAKDAKAAQRLAERTARQNANQQSQIQSQLQAIDKLAASLPTARAQILLQDARAAAENPNLQQTLETLRGLIDAAKAELAAATKVRTPRAMQAITPGGTTAVKKPGSRNERMAEYVPARGLPQSVQNLLGNPPVAFDDVMEVLGGRLLTVEPSCRPMLESMYRDGDLHFKRLVVLRLSELQSTTPTSGTQWKPMPGTERLLWEGNVGTQHKLMVRHNGGTFMSSDSIWTVVSIRTTSAKSAARAATPSAPLRAVTP